MWGKAIVVVLLAVLANFYMGDREYGWSDLHFAAYDGDLARVNEILQWRRP